MSPHDFPLDLDLVDDRLKELGADEAAAREAVLEARRQALATGIYRNSESRVSQRYYISNFWIDAVLMEGVFQVYGLDRLEPRWADFVLKSAEDYEWNFDDVKPQLASFYLYNEINAFKALLEARERAAQDMAVYGPDGAFRGQYVILGYLVAFELTDFVFKVCEITTTHLPEPGGPSGRFFHRGNELQPLADKDGELFHHCRAEDVDDVDDPGRVTLMDSGDGNDTFISAVMTAVSGGDPDTNDKITVSTADGITDAADACNLGTDIITVTGGGAGNNAVISGASDIVCVSIDDDGREVSEFGAARQTVDVGATAEARLGALLSSAAPVVLPEVQTGWYGAIDLGYAYSAADLGVCNGAFDRSLSHLWAFCRYGDNGRGHHSFVTHLSDVVTEQATSRQNLDVRRALFFGDRNALRETFGPAAVCGGLTWSPLAIKVVATRIDLFETGFDPSQVTAGALEVRGRFTDGERTLTVAWPPPRPVTFVRSEALITAPLALPGIHLFGSGQVATAKPVALRQIPRGRAELSELNMTPGGRRAGPGAHPSITLGDTPWNVVKETPDEFRTARSDPGLYELPSSPALSQLDLLLMGQRKASPARTSARRLGENPVFNNHPNVSAFDRTFDAGDVFTRDAPLRYVEDTGKGAPKRGEQTAVLDRGGAGEDDGRWR